MNTQVIERPDMEIIESPADPNKPEIAHEFCHICNKVPPSGMLRPGMVAFCGAVKRSPTRQAHINWPAGSQVCVVCYALHGRCPKCGTS